MPLYVKFSRFALFTLFAFALSACSSTSTKNLLGKPAKGYKSAAATTPALVVPQPLSRAQFKDYNGVQTVSPNAAHVSLVPPGSRLDQYKKKNNK